MTISMLQQPITLKKGTKIISCPKFKPCPFHLKGVYVVDRDDIYENKERLTIHHEHLLQCG